MAIGDIVAGKLKALIDRPNEGDGTYENLGLSRSSNDEGMVIDARAEVKGMFAAAAKDRRYGFKDSEYVNWRGK